MNPVSYFEIPVLDIERATHFYAAVFGFAFERLHIDGKDMALFPNVDGAGGASGALAKGDGYCPGTAGPRIFFNVPNMAVALLRVSKAGGAVLRPEQPVGDFGCVADIADTEGNGIALYAPAAAPRLERGGFLSCVNGKMQVICDCC
jgi:predicted enzyme related to lactoylglutathione lyase